MLTVEKIKVYESYGGDIDGWARCKGAGNTEAMTDGDWYLIEELRQGLTLVAFGATKEFVESVEARLKAVMADEAAYHAIKALAGKKR